MTVREAKIRRKKKHTCGAKPSCPSRVTPADVGGNTATVVTGKVADRVLTKISGPKGSAGASSKEMKEGAAIQTYR